MFETAILSYGPPSKRVWATFAGITGQALLVTCAVLAPMISPQMLPRAAWIATITAPGAPPPPGPVVRPKTAGGRAPQVVKHMLILPASIPPKALMLVDDDPGPDLAAGPGVPGGVTNGLPNGIPGGIVTDLIAHAAPVVKPPEPVVNTSPKPVAKPSRISMIQMARPIHRVEPVYPALARQMRISGVVELQGVIGTDGRIHELKVLSGHPMLVKAAVDAVSQWMYAPTVLNGQAVEVAAPITVNFKLGQ
jgi:periplasmic protein TonB